MQPAPRVRSANIRDVAKMAGVSHQTVSRVINGHPSLREGTRQRVLDRTRAQDRKFKRIPAQVLTGILGAILGGWIGGLLFNLDLNESFWSFWTWVFAIIGGVIVAFIWQAITRRRGSRV